MSQPALICIKRIAVLARINAFCRPERFERIALRGDITRGNFHSSVALATAFVLIKPAHTA